MDIRLQQLSYSSRLLLHECPRKFQLNRLNTEIENHREDDDSQLTFQYGHTVGEGIQLLLAGKSMQEVIWISFLKWKQDLFADDVKRKKSFTLAVIALQKFSALRSAGFLKEYELVYYKGKPAVELGFRIHIPGGFKYRGFVDVVLRHRETGEVLVLEIKTSSGNVIANSYKNSAQAIGYSVILDFLFPKLSSYKVLYLVYKTKELEYEPVSYNKSYLQRALWIEELLIEVDKLKLYESRGVYPMHGESCVGKFYKECKYLGTCTLSTERLTSPLTPESLEKLEKESYDAEVSLEDLIKTQLENTKGIEDHEPEPTSTNRVYTTGLEDQIL